MKFPERSASMSKDIIKMKADESVTGVFRGEIFTFRQHWENKKCTICAGADCPKCDAGHKPTFRFRLNFVMRENGTLVAKIFEQGWTVMETLQALNEDYPLEQHLMKVTRHGNGVSDTTYNILPAKNSLITPAQEAEISKVKLHNLDPNAKELEFPPADTGDYEQDSIGAEGF